MSVHPARELLSCPVPNPTAPTLRNPTAPTLRNRTSDPDTLSIFTLLACHPLLTHFPSLSLCTFHPFVVSTLALSDSATFLSVACVLKRFLLTSPCKLALTCVKRGFLRTAEPHRTSQLSPCAPLMSQCHVHAVPGSDVPCPCTTAPSASPARELLSCPCVLTPHLPPFAIPHLTPDPLSILSLLAFHPFVVSTPAFSNSSHVSFRGVRTKTFSTHVIT